MGFDVATTDLGGLYTRHGSDLDVSLLLFLSGTSHTQAPLGGNAISMLSLKMLNKISNSAICDIDHPFLDNGIFALCHSPASSFSGYPMSLDIVDHGQAFYLECMLQGCPGPLNCVLWVYMCNQGQEQRDRQITVPCTSAVAILCLFHLYDGYHGWI